MDITPLINIDQQFIQSYGQGRFRISNIVYEHAVIVMPSRTVEWGVGESMSRLTPDDFKILVEAAGELDVILVGSGAKSERPSQAVRQMLKDRGLNIECMDTGAACRTYNVLMAEGRRVGAALLAV